MRLKTEVSPLGRGESDFTYESDDDCRHDAAAAHALMQAMDEWGEKEYGAIDKLAVRWVHLRADELLRSWGFEE